jgi:flagellar basal-body rod modification protein FlgD
MTDPINATGVNETDYMKLFTQELTYQDPLKPIDNREFMTQMAQFSALQEARSTNEYLIKLLGMTSGNQCLELLGKKVRIKDSEYDGVVSHVEFSEHEPPRVSVAMPHGKITQVELTKITQVSEG